MVAANPATFRSVTSVGSRVRRPRWFALALAGVVGAWPMAAAQAGALRPELIDHDASWVMHLDVEQLSRAAMRDAMQNGSHPIFRQSARSLENMQRELKGLDPFALFRDVTMYGTGEAGAKVAAIFSTTALGDRLGELVREKEAYATLTVEDEPLVTWRDDGRTWFAHEERTGDDARRITVAEEAQIVIDALGVQRGDRRSMRGELASRFVAPPAAGSIFYLAGEKPAEFPHDEMTSAIVKQADRLAMEWGESASGELFASVKMIAKGAREAEEIAGTLAGFTVLARAQARREARYQPWQSLLEQLTLTTDGLRVDCTFRAGAQRVIAAMEESHRIAEAERIEVEGQGRGKSPDSVSFSGSGVNADRREGPR